MNISILGTGNMASSLAILFANGGHRVTLASRDPSKARSAATELGNDIQARAFASRPRTERSIVFLAVGAEERILQGGAAAVGCSRC